MKYIKFYNFSPEPMKVSTKNFFIIKRDEFIVAAHVPR